MLRKGQAGHLKVEIFESREALGVKAAKDAAEALKQVIEEKGSANVIFAAAPSQNEFLAMLAKSDVDFTKVHAFHMDEYIGLEKAAPQGFGNFLRAHIFDLAPFASVSYIDGSAADIEAERIRYSNILREHPVDLVFLGIGSGGCPF